jgi:endoglucanase
MLAGHLDEIGFIVTHVSEQGYLHFAALGGLDAAVLPGSRVTVLAEKGALDGVIGMKAIHLTEPDERKKVIEIKDLWIDIGAKDRRDAARHVAVGDVAAFAPNFVWLRNRRFASKACDNKAGAFVVSEVLKRLRRRRLAVAVYGVATAQEEVGLRGAQTSGYRIAPQAAIALDVGFASDTPGIDKRVVGEVDLGKGPILHAGPNINPVLGRLLVKTARRRGIAYQFSSEPRITGTDAAAMQVLHEGVATALVSIPNRYMHTQVETCSLDDLDAAADLVAETVLAIKPGMSFIP